MKKHDMNRPYLVEESTFFDFPPSLERVIETLEQNETTTHHEFLIAMLIILLRESGFRMLTKDGSPESDDQVFIPKDWKTEGTNSYEVDFILKMGPDIRCKLVASALGDTLLINSFPIKENKTVYCLSIQTLKYVIPYAISKQLRYINLTEISHRFKDAIATRVRCDILEDAGMLHPSLPGLPEELRIKIIELTYVKVEFKAYPVTKTHPKIREYFNRLVFKTVPRN